MKRPWQIWMLFAFCLALVIPAMVWLTLKALELDRTEAEAQRRAVASRRMETEARRQAEAARKLAELSRHQAELQERVSSALWRMDWTLTPLVAQEAARPHFVYQPFYPAYVARDGNAGAGGKPVKGGKTVGDNKPVTGSKVVKDSVETEGEVEVREVPSPLLVQPSVYVLLHFQCSADGQWTSPQNPTGLAGTAAVENGTPADNIRLSGKRLDQLKQDIDRGALLSMLPERLLPPVEVKSVQMANNFSYNYNGDSLPGNSVEVNTLGLDQLDQQIQSSQQSEIPPQQPNAPPAAPNPSPDQVSQAPAPQHTANLPGVNPSSGTQAAQPQRLQPPSRQPQPQYAQQQPAPPQTAQLQSGQPQAPQPAQGQAGSPSQGANQPAFNQGNQSTNANQGRSPRRGGTPDALTQNQMAAVDDYLANVREQMRRGREEWQGRNSAYQSFAQSQLLQQRANTSEPAFPSPRHLVGEGVTRPVWIGTKLILARRVVVDGQVLIQGCWLDWPKIKQMLLAEGREILPEMELVPATPQSNVQPGRMLATLPVQLVVSEPTVSSSVLEFELVSDEPQTPPPAWSAIRISLVIAWVGLALATVAVGILLQGVVTLSERRGSFVSAVTHELRTPLTTFRMYAEMLSAGMVPDADKRQEYLETLRVEADRLSHLVENVLAYARLERGNPGRRREAVTLATLLDRVESRLSDRAKQAGMKLVVEADEPARQCRVSTDPAAVEQILFNLVDNSCKYAARADDRRIHLTLEKAAGEARIRVRDHGDGIAPREAKRLFRPFSKSVHEAAATAPGVGLGLALCRRLAHALGGRLELEPVAGGASFLLTLKTANAEA